MARFREHITTKIIWPVIVSLLVSGVGWAFVINRNDGVQDTKLELMQKQLDRIEKGVDDLRKEIRESK